MNSNLSTLNAANGDSNISLFSAAQWIVAQKDAKAIDSEIFCVWESAYAELRANIVSGKITVIGIERDEAHYVKTDGSAPTDIVPGHRFSDCAIQCPYNTSDFDVAFGNRSWLLRSYPDVDEDEWNGKFQRCTIES